MVDLADETTTRLRRRWRIAGLLSLASALNYLDRQTLSVMAGTMQTELGMSDVDYSYVTSAFLFSYTAMYVVSGRLVDRFGTRRGFAWSVGGWSLATMGHALVQTAGQLAGVRFVLGVFESANFPAGIRAVTEWFPVRERALAVGIFNAGASVGSAVAVPLISLLALNFGWRSAFVVTGALGLVWLLAWQRWYHLPRAGGEGGERVPEKTVPLLALLRRPELWACVAARVLIDPVTYFLNFWIPKYLQTEQGFDLKTLGFAAWIPYAALAVGAIAGGSLPAALIRRGWSLHRARMAVMVGASALMPLGYWLLSGTASPVGAVACIAALMFLHGSWSNITLPTELFSRSVQGTVTGLGGTLGGLAGMGTQLLIGYTVQQGSYTPVFVAAGLAYAVAFLLVRGLGGTLGREVV
jgi:ACS family hexuronate transporter-like MFS transporter